MCNACGFYCCGYDGFSKCGCDHCPEPECHDDDDDLFYSDDCPDDRIYFFVPFIGTISAESWEVPEEWL